MIFGFCCFAKMFSLSFIPPEIISDDTILRYEFSYYGFEYELFEYDENGNLIHFKNWDVNLKFEYEFFPSGNIKRKITRKVE